MNELKERLNELVSNKTIKKSVLIALMNEFKIKPDKTMLDELFSKQQVTKKDILKLFQKKKKTRKKTQIEEKIIEIVKKTRKIKITKLAVFKTGILIVFCVSFFMAVVNVYSTLLLSNDSFHAKASSVVLVGFNLICFESIIFIALIKIKLKALLILFLSFLWLTISLFIFLAITKSQFDRYQSTLFEKRAENNEDYAGLNEDNAYTISSLRKEIENREEKRSNIEKTMENQDKKAKEYTDNYWRVFYINNEIKDFNAKLEEAKAEKKDLLVNKKTTIIKIDFFVYIKKYIFKTLNVSLLEFIMLILPSLFYDIISSTSLALVFFLKEGEEQ